MTNYVINLDRRTDRLVLVHNEFEKMGMTFVRYPAYPDPVGWRGCKKSHLELLQTIHGIYDIPPQEVAAIYEDDVMFLQGERIIEMVMKELPEDWDMLYLGASPQEPFTRYSPHLFRMGKSWTTHAIVWHNRKDGVIDFILRNQDTIDKWDVFLSEWIHPKFNCFLAYPLIATQHQTKSDIARRSDVSTIEKNYYKYCI